jgi:hypothetical protein
MIALEFVNDGRNLKKDLAGGLNYRCLQNKILLKLLFSSRICSQGNQYIAPLGVRLTILPCHTTI